MDDRDAGVGAAANTIASWARARRASWNDAAGTTIHRAIDAVDPVPAAAPVTAAMQGPPADVSRAASAPFEAEPSAPIVTTKKSGTRKAVGGMLGRWLPRGAAAIALAAVGGTACAYLLRPANPVERRPAAKALVSRPPRTVAAAPVVVPHTPMGRLEVMSDPSGAQVLVDGRPRGVTPLTIADLNPAVHQVVIDSAKGSVRRSIAIVDNETAKMSELIFAGWVAVVVPFEVTIADGTHAVQMDDRNQVLLPPGPHVLHIQNRVLGYDEVRRVEVKPGEITTLSVSPSRTTLSVTANAPASVWIDGSHIGDTPVSGVPVDLGSHEVMVKSAEQDDRRLTVTATVNPLVLDIDFSKPPKR
jgi:PEGA domain-containing protein